MPKVPKVTKLQNLGKKEVRHKFNFLHEDKHQSFLKLIPSFLVALVRNAQGTQNNKFLQYFCNIPRKKGGIKLTLAYR